MLKGFSAKEWAQAIESGQITVVATTPQKPIVLRMIMAPIHFVRWTIDVRSGNHDVAAHKWDRALPIVH